MEPNSSLALTAEKARFSPNGQYLSVCGGDGRLRIWDTEGGSIKQEFVPSAHLTATFTCIEWAPSPDSAIPQRKGSKKKKRRVIEEDLVTMGTAVGTLVFYSVAKSQLLAHTKEGHSGQVTGLAWDPSTFALYSCGEDGYVIEWDPESTKIVSRWKANKAGLNSIRVFTKDSLLAAGTSITLWNLETKTALFQYLGHSGPISQLELVPGSDYFVTLCSTERHLRIWTKGDKNAIGTLALSDNPSRFHVMSSDSSTVSVTVVTQQGVLNLFQQKLNGPVRKPQKPISIFKITDVSPDAGPVPILGSNLEQDAEDSYVQVSFGSWLRLRFEKHSLKDLRDEVTIKREFHLSKKKRDKSLKRSQGTVALGVEGKEIVEVPLNVKHLQPGIDTSSKPDKGKKRKSLAVGGETTEKVEQGELPMEERLSNLTLEKPSSGAIPDGNNLAHLLSQGLHSKDGRILHSVLSRWDDEVITNTVRTLPVQLVVPLLNEIKTMLSGKALVNHSVVRWLKAVFQIHSAFLMSCSSTEDLLGPFLSLLRSRETLYPQMCQLKGKLELIKGNIKAKEHKTETPNEALLVYNDESSEEEMGEDDDLIPSESEEFIDSDDLGIDDDNENTSAASNSDSGSGSDDDDEKPSDDDETVKPMTNQVNGGKGKLMNGIGEEEDDQSMEEEDDD